MVPPGGGKIVLLVEVLTGKDLAVRIGGGQGMKPVQIGDTHFGKPVSSVRQT